MIVHQNEGMNGNVVFEAGFTQQSPVVMAILVVNEDRRLIHATLDDMKRNMSRDQACATGHGMKPRMRHQEDRTNASHVHRPTRPTMRALLGDECEAVTQ